MRATRVYIAGFGTAGSVVAGCAILFVVASAIVAFAGWPRIAALSAPPSLRLDGSAPVRGSRVDRRLAPVIAAATAPARREAAGAGAPGATGVRPPAGGSAWGRERGATVPTRAVAASGGSGSGSAGGTTRSPLTVHAGPVTTSAGGGAPPTVSVTATPASPPVSVTAPTGPAGQGVDQVSSGAGQIVSSAGAAAGAAVGGSGGSTVSQLAGAAAGTVSQAGGTAGNLLGG